MKMLSPVTFFNITRDNVNFNLKNQFSINRSIVVFAVSTFTDSAQSVPHFIQAADLTASA